MSKQLTAILSLTMLVFLTGCGGAGKSDSNDASSGSSIAGILGGSDYVSSEDLDKLDEQCEILTLEDVQKYATGVDASSIQQLDILGCQYSWDKSNIEEIEAQNNQIMSDGLAKGLGFIEIAEMQLSTDNRVSLSIDTFFANQTEERVDAQFRAAANMSTDAEKDAANKALKDAFNSLGSENETSDKASEVAEDLNLGDGAQDIIDNGATDLQKDIAGGLLDGITAEQKKDIYEMVDGVGTKAAWSNHSNNLVVLHRNIIFNVNVDIVDDATDQKTAKEIAEMVIKRIDKKL